MVRPLTGITTFYFFRSMRKPLIGYFRRVRLLPYYEMAWLGTYQRRILPSEPKERRLWLVSILPGGRYAHQLIFVMQSLWK